MGFVSIILLNYNGKKFNKECIDSILLQSYKNFEIIFVDNASTDGSVEEVEKIFRKEISDKKIIIVKNQANTGFTGGNNLGVKYASREAEYICLLNNDTTVPSNRLEELVKGIESDNKLGAVGSIILDKGYEEEILKQIFEDKKKFMLSVFGETILEPIEEGELNEGLFYTNGLSGCCILYRNELIEKPFEDYYFAYAEDVYLSRKILSLGYSLGICINSFINHYGSGSFGKKPSALKLFHGNKNQIINFLLFYNVGYKLILLPLFIMKEIGHLFLGNMGLRIISKSKGIIWIIKNWNKIKISRSMIVKQSCLSNKQFIEKLYFKISDTSYFNKQKKFLKIVLKIVNRFFLMYGKIISLI